MNQPTAPTRDPFFHLDGNFSEISTFKDLQNHLKKSNHLKNALYRPDTMLWDSERSPTEPQRFRIAGVTFENVSFSKTRIGQISFQKCRFENCLFIGTQVHDVEFHDCNFVSCNTHKISIENTYLDPHSFAKCLDWKRHSNIGVHLYQQLMKNSRDEDQPSYLSEAEFMFHKWKRYQNIYDLRKVRFQNLSLIWIIFLDWMYEKFVGYGIRFRNFAFTTLIFFIFLFVLNFVFWTDLGLYDHIENNRETSLLKSFYFTTITLTTLGFGDITPKTELGRFFASIESIVGIVWFAVLASMIFKKITR